jgi:lysophospholipase L1-like esterase
VKKWSFVLGWLATVALLGIPSLAAGPPHAPSARQSGHWVDSWGSMPQLTETSNMPPAPFTQDGLVMADTTLRQTVHLSIGGDHLRLRFSNAFCGAALPITSASVALPAGGAAGVSAITPGSNHPLTFSHRASTVIPVGAQVVSDPINLHVASQSNLTVTIYLAQGQASNSITSHPGSRTNSYLLAGNHLNDADLPGAASVAHWYFLSTLEVWALPQATALSIVGDSLTDGRGSTTNGNDRWPDQLLARLQADRRTAQVAVINQAAGGNRVLNDGLGPNALGRIDRDVLAHSGTNWMLVFEGVNDIGTAAATPQAQQQVTDDLIAAFQQMVTRAHAAGIAGYGATITPFGANTGYDDPDGYREAARQAVNTWILTPGHFDAVVDFDKVARDPANPRQLNPAYDVGDHLHFNPTGYGVLAAAVPSRWFLTTPGPFGLS